MIYLGADHAGFSLKEKIKFYLESKKIPYDDLSPVKIPEDDYPLIAYKLAESVAHSQTKGILICGTGVGMSIVANKVQGIRAAAISDKKTASLSRKHNDANILCLGSRILSPQKAITITKIWLSAKEPNEPRHQRRIKQIESLEWH